MSVVVDANLLAALVLPLPYQESAQHLADSWVMTGIEIIAPTLAQYEVASLLRRAVFVNSITVQFAAEAIYQIHRLGVSFEPPTVELHLRALYWAERLRQSKAYDAHYLALAEREKAPFWTADKRLHNGARQVGISWTQWLGDHIHGVG